ncbi:MAG: AMP-binding protein [Promethearchaeota archaeon]
MTSLKGFKVNENKVWFNGGYWPTGVPKQIYDVEGIVIEPLFDGFIRSIEDLGIWDMDICIAVFGPYLERISFKKLIEFSKKFGTYLYEELGIRKGDVIAIDLPNSINFVVAYIGSLYIGAIVAGINPTYKPMELVHALQITDSKVLVMLDMFYELGPKTILQKTKVKHVISTNMLDFVTAEKPIFDSLRTNIPDAQGSVPDKTEDYKVHRMKKIIDETESKEIQVEIDPWTHPAVYLMTGGTTGLPKAAILSHANLLVNLYQQRDWVSLETGMLNIGIIPFFHSFGLTSVMNGSLFIGMPMVIFTKPPEAKLLCETIKKLDAPQKVIYACVELLFKHLIDFVEEMGVDKFKKEYDLHEKLKYASQGAGPLHDYIQIPFEKIFCPIRPGYGLTETSPVVSSSPFWGPNKDGKIGLAIPGSDIIIVDANDFDIGPICDGTPELNHFGVEYTGEICVAGPQVMLGYKGEQQEQEDNIKFWNGKRWLLTGDIGFLDEHGFLEIRDRKKSLVKVAGHSVFPKEVEMLLGQHPMVNEAAVAGLPDLKRGETVKAWVTLKSEYKEGIDITSEQLKKWCEEKMSRWKCPSYIEFIKELPITTTGKVQRRELQEKDIDIIKEGNQIKG